MLESAYEREFEIALGNISLPTLVIHGTKDTIVPLKLGQQIADAIPDAELVVFEGTGHVPTMTRPHEVVAAIQRRFREIAGFS